MAHTEDFDAFMKDVVTHETAPIAHSQHPPLEVFFAQLAGELTPDAQSKFIAHLATCSECRARWRSLKETLYNEQTTLESKKHVPGFVELVRRQREPVALQKRIHDWLSTLLPWREFKPVWGIAISSVITIAITLAVAIPLLRGPVVATSGHLIALTNQVHTLQSQVNNLTQTQINIMNNALPAKITPEEIAQLSEKTKGITDPWQKAIFIAAFLNEYGVRIPENFDWQRLQTYTIRAGDTWESIATTYLGNKQWWPLICLLNAERVPPNKPLTSGEKILLPTLLK